MKKNYQTKTSRAATGRVTPKKKPPTAPPATDEMELGLPDWALPPTVRVAMTDLAETAREGLLALAVGAGLGVLQVLMDEDVTAVAGPKGKWNPDRVAGKTQQATRPPAAAGGSSQDGGDSYGRVGVKGPLRRPSAALDPDPGAGGR